MRTYKAYGW